MTFYRSYTYSHSHLKHKRVSHCIHASLQHYHLWIFANFKITFLLILKQHMIRMLICISLILSYAEHLLAILSLICDFSVDALCPILWEGGRGWKWLSFLNNVFEVRDWFIHSEHFLNTYMCKALGETAETVLPPVELTLWWNWQYLFTLG